LSNTRQSPSIPASDSGYQLQLLGDFRIHVNGRPVASACYSTMRALLAYLAVEQGLDHSRETLAGLLWSNHSAAAARGNLRRTLADLRRVVELPSGTVLFSTSKHSIRYVGTGHVDVRAFTEHVPEPVETGSPAPDHDERVLALYRGDFLAGLALPDSPEFEHWLQVQRESLRRRALALLERLSNQHESAGGYPKALEFALRYEQLEPWDEDACRRVMLLHTLNGQDKAALSHYEACCRRLQDDLGELPGVETTRLAERIRDGAVQREQSRAQQLQPAQPMVQAPAQRRHATVLYCEFLLAPAMDPEEAMATLDAPRGRCVSTIEQHGGHMVPTQGGGMLAYFGYPVAHEGAARRAVQAALAVQRAMAPATPVRAGIHTGLIITGAQVSAPDTSGGTTRIAVQLCHRLEACQIAISQDTHRIVGWYFDCTRLGTQEFPGSGQALEIFDVRGESGARDRLDAPGRLRPMVGRTRELAQLMACWEAAAQGSRQVVLLRGEAGMGKSRMLHALKEGLAHAPHAVVELRCFPEFSQSPFHPLSAMLEDSMGIVAGDAAERNFTRLARCLEGAFPNQAQEGVPLLAQLLSLPLGARYRGLDISAQRQKDRMIELMLALLQELASRMPVLLVLEDLHWMDPSTLELVTRFIDQPAQAPILAVLTTRPEPATPWSGDRVTPIELGALGEQDVVELVTSLRPDLAPATVRHIAGHVDGVPLFAEELTKFASADHRVRIPATLQDLLAASIDRLGETRATAQLAATLGREFDLAVLRGVVPGDATELTDCLDALLDAQVLSMRGESGFQFKHFLIQQAAYESQTLSARRSAHQRIAKVLLDDFPEVGLTHPENLARHLAAGGEAPLAVTYWNRAAQRAALRCAHAEAMAHCQAGLELLETLAASSERDHLECALRVNLGATLIATRGYGSVEAETQYARAAQLASTSSHGADLFTAMWGLWLGSSSRSGHAHSLELAGKLLQLAEQARDPLQLQKAHYAMGNSLLWTGQLPLAQHHQERAMALYQPAHHDALVRELGENICVSTGSQLAWVLWLQGLPDQARAMGEQTLALAHALNHPYSRCYASAHLISLHRWLRQVDATWHWAQETVLQAQRHGFPLWLLSGLAFQGWVQAQRGDASGLSQLQSGVEAVRAAMGGIEAFFLAPLAEAHWHLRQPEEAQALARHALAVMQARDDHFLESELLRIQGECLLVNATPDPAAAETCFQRALTISRHQGARSLELRAATSLARLWHRQGKSDEARRMLTEICDWFTQGLDTPDLVDANQLLEQLARTAGVA